MPDLATQFDYAALDTEARVVVKQKTTEIRDRMKRAASDIVAIGERLIAVRDILPNQFSAWLKAEFDLDRRTAYNMIAVAERFSGENFSQLNIAPSALYLLASPSIPPVVREAVLSEAKEGKQISHADVKQRMEATRNPEPPKSLDEQCADENDYLDSIGMGGGDPAAPKRINIKRADEDEDDVPATVTLERQVEHVVTRKPDPEKEKWEEYAPLARVLRELDSFCNKPSYQLSVVELKRISSAIKTALQEIL